MNQEQLKTILWLRWRLTLNQWRRSGGLGAAIAIIITAAAVLLGASSFVGALLGGALGMGDAPPLAVMGLWFGVTVAFLVFWVIGLLAELQRSETIDLRRLMHLPVGLGQMFAINYVASLFALSLILTVPAMTGLAIGLTWSRGPAMSLLLPLGWSMVFMITAWTYCLRGWLASMMANPRRRRAILMGITVSFILVAQLPNLFANVYNRRDRAVKKPGVTAQETQRDRDLRRAADKQRMANLIEMQKFIPPLWLPYGALGLAEQRILPALLGTLGCACLGAMGLRRAYRSTLKFYLGDTGGRAGAGIALTSPTAGSAPVKPAGNWLEWRLPAVPEQAAAVALGTLRSILRAPEVKMAWGTAFIVTAVAGSGLLFRAAPKMPDAGKPFVMVFALALPMFMLVQFFGNQFGYDRQGFRAFVLSPADRRLILLGKNLAAWPVGGCFGFILLAAIVVWLNIPFLTAAAGMIQLAMLLLLVSLAGNLLSILVPFRMEIGSMKPTKMPGLAMVLMVLCQLLFPVVVLPVCVPPLAEYLWVKAGGPAFVPVNFLLSLLLAGLAAVAYWKALGPLGRLLERREISILNTVTAGQE